MHKLCIYLNLTFLTKHFKMWYMYKQTTTLHGDYILCDDYISLLFFVPRSQNGLPVCNKHPVLYLLRSKHSHALVKLYVCV